MTVIPSSNNEPTLTDVSVRIDKLSVNVNRFDERFADYRQATQWVVQLAFTLMKSATIIVIITSVFRK